jgi:hypothetical protein
MTVETGLGGPDLILSVSTYLCSIDSGPRLRPGRARQPPLLRTRDQRGRHRRRRLLSWTVDLPSKCVLRTARARVFVFTAHDKVRLVIHYRMYRKAKVTVGYKLAGRKGRLNLGRAGAS